MSFKYSYLRVRDNNEVVVADFQQSSILDEAAIERIGVEFDRLVLEAVTAKKLLVNFRGVEYMSSAMIGKLIHLSKKCKEAKVKLKLCGVGPKINEIFQLMKLNKVFDIQKDEKGAIEAFNSPSLSNWFGLKS
ncbi:STAS domain-containing protein [Blastopirellula marina]|uniref:Probable anti-anti-sigma regulatory factor (Antagonist ofanti-sigma factor) n=1 Tax=Blastopirellula marina DSM 3645 TaxID=314230 RepID=A3ZZP2_9BACT|nr:STAS domain-containing protein [Blastopirellula marina]EAQ78044.1 probable anti-anti-sigma regulatory factor (antagonist ofanti-sigma factor) [Blastopirellula marina DSM 3645]